MIDSTAAPEPLLPERLARAITLGGPIPLSQFMGAANAHYYGTRDPLGARGDFTTAPEISQMFGELIGAWLADLAARAGAQSHRYVEFGPGRGTLAADALRVLGKAGMQPPVHLIENSPTLRTAQAERVPGAEWHLDLLGVPEDAPLLVVANEFFDALPIRQLVATADGWRERLVACQDTLFLPIAGDRSFDMIIPKPLREAAAGSILETSPASVAILRGLAARLEKQGGAALIIDYGYEGPAIGDTLQAVRGHQYANPFDAPGEADLTAHVDFGTLKEAAEAEGMVVHGAVTQGAFLKALGIEARTEALSRAAPERAEQLAADRDRLIGDEAMGDLFKVMALTAPGWPVPAGFA
ncbi:class I SAM-dependent methyltransferase [Sphingomonas xinjiangensis]|uniref:SAM-dependent MidA family methyltransferase n=1 Tax=Sphingomonas xinjiangensis TaxID=643568 RepID=A0A840YGE0_9SPHN|nr:SAM-dependent methyltransferase [Sphingomonas xinjiangensis]MBB5711365.1 SAM-dependent MidA family methyltransferase [Sphingomonas xinjiangensis]